MQLQAVTSMEEMLRNDGLTPLQCSIIRGQEDWVC